MSAMIDPIEFGRLMAEVRHLSAQLEAANEKMETLSARLSEVEDRYKLGKAGITGLVVGLGFTIYGLKEGLSRLMGWASP